MDNRMHRTSFAALALALGLSIPAVAEAAPSKASCGNVDLLTVSECHFEFTGGCKADCVPLSFQAACDGSCDIAIDASCSASCSASCTADCDIDPPTFDCSASCQADCELQTQTLCGADAECIQYCQADCNANCSAQCDVTAPSATCTEKCQAACDGSCDVTSNFDCSVSCTADLKGGCDIACETPDGGLFCDGQFVDIQNVDDCVAYLEQQFALSIKVQVKASVKASCSMGAPGSPGAAGFAALGLLGAALARRRRRS